MNGIESAMESGMNFNDCMTRSTIFLAASFVAVEDSARVVCWLLTAAWLILAIVSKVAHEKGQRVAAKSD